MADADDLWSEAIQEAYASAPSDEVILNTLELRHPSFEDSAIRIVMDFGEEYVIEGEVMEGHYFTLEDDAPIQASQTVFFQACAFSLELPEQREGSLPTIKVEIDNVTKKIITYLDQAIGERAPLEITFREYLLTDPSGPQFILPGMSMKSVDSNLNRVTGTAQFSDLMNKSFPKKLYRPGEFKGLVQ